MVAGQATASGVVFAPRKENAFENNGLFWYIAMVFCFRFLHSVNA
jgi:hypothetical protein